MFFHLCCGVKNKIFKKHPNKSFNCNWNNDTITYKPQSFRIFNLDPNQQITQVPNTKYPFGFKLIWRLRFVICVFLFFVQPIIVDKSTVNSAPVHYSQVSQITLFSNFFIKNESHNTIYTFKNYFVTVFSVSTKISCI